MRSPHDAREPGGSDGPPDRPDRPGALEVPSEIAEAFRSPVARLEPAPGTFTSLRRRAVARRRRRVVAVTAAVVVCLGAAGAGVTLLRPGDEAAEAPLASQPPTATPTVSPPPSTGATASSDPSPRGGEDSPGPGETNTAPPTGSDGPAELPICASDQLDLSLGTPDGAAGSLNMPLTFTNTGEAACGMTGFPGVSLVAGDEGEQIGRAAERGAEQGDPVRVELVPGATAFAGLRVTRAENYPAEDCDPLPARGLRVYPPDQREALFLPYDGLTGCASQEVTLLSVTVLYAAEQ